MKKDRSEQFIDYLIREYVKTYDRLIRLFKKVELMSQKKTDEHGKIMTITVLDPDSKQQKQSVAIHSDYRILTETVLAFLGLQSQEIKLEFSKLTDLFSTYILFQRIGTSITNRKWRELFFTESRILLLKHIDIIQNSKEAFKLLKPRNLLKYKEFSIKFNKFDSQNYKIEAQSDLGEADNSFTLPFDDIDLENFLLKYFQRRHGSTRGWTPKAIQPLADFGQKIFDAVVAGEVRDLFFRTSQSAETNKLGLRIKLRFKNTPALGDIPWELMYDGRDFLCLSNKTSITRYLDSTIQPRPLTLKPPFRILVTASSPMGLVSLDVEKEQKQLRTALAPLIALGIVRIDFASDGTLRTLQRMLRNAESSGEPYHIWHYIGHGGYDGSENTSLLVFEDDLKLQNPVSGFELGTLFNNHPSIRLVVLNSCEGARTSRQDTLSGIASALVDRGIPAVVAMQFEISDKAAIIFAEEFYAALADGLQVDAALSEARRSIFFSPNYVEWCTPALFMRVSDGFIFNFRTELSKIKLKTMRKKS